MPGGGAEEVIVTAALADFEVSATLFAVTVKPPAEEPAV